MTGEVSVGEIIGWGNCIWEVALGKLLLGKLRWGNDLTSPGPPHLRLKGL